MRYAEWTTSNARRSEADTNARRPAVLDKPERPSASNSSLLIETTTLSKSARQVRRHLERPINHLPYERLNYLGPDPSRPGAAISFCVSFLVLSRSGRQYRTAC